MRKFLEKGLHKQVVHYVLIYVSFLWGKAGVVLISAYIMPLTHVYDEALVHVLLMYAAQTFFDIDWDAK